jgi:HlyD family secretion protein
VTDSNPSALPARRVTAEPSANGEMLNRVQALRLDGANAAVKATSGGGASWLPWVLSLFLAVTWAGIGIKEYKGAGTIRQSFTRAPAGGTPNPSPTPAPGGGAASASAGPAVAPGSVVVAQKGVLIPTQQIAVSPIEVQGRLVELNVVEGKLFKKGDILAKIDDVSYRAQFAESEAMTAGTKMRLEMARQRLAELDPKSVRPVELEQAKAQLDETKAAQQRAKEELDRLTTVVKSGGGGLSTRELQQAEADVRTADARVSQMQSALTILTEGPRKERLRAAEAEILAAEADYRASQARLTQAKWRLDNCVITAPIDGTVLSKKAELGNLVNPLAFAATSGSVCDIANLAEMEVDMDIPERDIEKVFPGQRAKVVPDAFKTREYAAVVDRIMPIADDSKSVIKIRVKVMLPPGEVPGTFLKPKMSVVASLFAPDEKKNP